MGEYVAIREKMTGQKGERLYPVKCMNERCSINKKFGVEFHGKRLLGKYRVGTIGEVKCSRCNHINRFAVKEGGRVEKLTEK